MTDKQQQGKPQAQGREEEAELFFQNHGIKMTGVMAGEYIDKEDFLKFASSIPTEVQKDDCSQHKKEIAGISDMKVLAEMIGDLHYEALALLLYHLSDKFYVDGRKDSLAGRKRLGEALYDAQRETHRASQHIDKAYKHSEPHMRSTPASSAPPISHMEDEKY